MLNVFGHESRQVGCGRKICVYEQSKLRGSTRSRRSNPS